MWCCWISPGHNPPSSLSGAQYPPTFASVTLDIATGRHPKALVPTGRPASPDRPAHTADRCPDIRDGRRRDQSATEVRRPELFCWQATHLKVPTGRAQAKPNTFPATNGLRVLAAPTNNPQALAECRPLADTIFDCPPERRRFPRSIASENFGKARGMG